MAKIEVEFQATVKAIKIFEDELERITCRAQRQQDRTRQAMLRLRELLASSDAGAEWRMRDIIDDWLCELKETMSKSMVVKRECGYLTVQGQFKKFRKPDGSIDLYFEPEFEQETCTNCNGTGLV